MDVLDDIDVPSVADETTTVYEPEHRNNQLLHRLQKLKAEAAFWQYEIERDKSHTVYHDSELVDALLNRNDKYMGQMKKDEGLVAEGENPVMPKRDLNVELLAKFHGLEFEPVTTSKLVGRDLFLNKFTGKCAQYFSFDVELYVHPLDHSVSWFNVATSPGVARELDPLISRTKQSKNILECMHGIAEYGNMYKTRYKVFERLSQEYQADDDLWRSTQTFCFKPLNGFQLMLYWPIDTSKEPVARPTIELKASKSYISADKTRALEKSKAVFNTLVKSKGVYSATCIMYQIFHGS